MKLMGMRGLAVFMLAVMAPGAAVLAQPVSATRTVNPDVAIPSNPISVAVDFTVDVPEAAAPAAVIIVENVPAGWAITNVSPEAAIVDPINGEINWLLGDLAPLGIDLEVADGVFTYTLTPPSGIIQTVYPLFGRLDYLDGGDAFSTPTAGEDAVSVPPVPFEPLWLAGLFLLMGVFGLWAVRNVERSTMMATRGMMLALGAGAVWGGAAFAQVSAERSISPGEIAPDAFAVITVSVDVNESNAPNGAIVTESIPIGWQLSMVNPEAAGFNEATGEISWLLGGLAAFGDTVLTYRLAPPADAETGQRASVSGEVKYRLDEVDTVDTISGESAIEVAEEAAPIVAADVDASGAVDSVDIQLVINSVLEIAMHDRADIDGNGKLDSADVQLVINGALGV